MKYKSYRLFSPTIGCLFGFVLGFVFVCIALPSPHQCIFPPKSTLLFWFPDFLKRTTKHSPSLKKYFWGILLRILRKCQIKPTKHSSLSLGPFEMELLESTWKTPKNNSKSNLQSAHIFMSVWTLYHIIK